MDFHLMKTMDAPLNKEGGVALAESWAELLHKVAPLFLFTPNMPITAFIFSPWRMIF